MSISPVPGIKPATFSFRSVKKIGVLSEHIPYYMTEFVSSRI